MTGQELLDFLREEVRPLLEGASRTRFESGLANDPDQVEKLYALKADLDAQIDALEAQDFAALSREFGKLEPVLVQGIERIQRDTTALARTAAALETFAAIAGIVARSAALVAST